MRISKQAIREVVGHCYMEFHCNYCIAVCNTHSLNVKDRCTVKRHPMTSETDMHSDVVQSSSLPT